MLPPSNISYQCYLQTFTRKYYLHTTLPKLSHHIKKNNSSRHFNNSCALKWMTILKAREFTLICGKQRRQGIHVHSQGIKLSMVKTLFTARAAMSSIGATTTNTALFQMHSHMGMHTVQTIIIITTITITAPHFNADKHHQHHHTSSRHQKATRTVGNAESVGPRVLTYWLIA